MRKTLDENGVKDDTPDFDQVNPPPRTLAPNPTPGPSVRPHRTLLLRQLNIDEDFYTPVLHLYFSDDLTVA